MVANTHLAKGLPFLALMSFSAIAEINISGFASVRAGKMFTTSPEQGQIPYDNKVSFKHESLIGLQVSGNVSDKVEAVVQLQAEGSNDWDLEARWAYISYQITPQYQLKIGQLVNPLYHQSEYENVGFTNNYARLPKSVYQDQDYNTLDGASLTGKYQWGESDITASLIYGSWEGETFLPSINSFDSLAFRDMAGGNIEASIDNLTLFAGGWIGEIDWAEFDVRLVGIAQNILNNQNSDIQLADDNGNLLPEYQGFIDAIGWHEKDVMFAYAGFNWQYQDWIFEAEMNLVGVKDASDAFNEGYFVAIGRRIGDWIITVHTEDWSQDVDFSVTDPVQDPVLKQVGNQIETNFGIRAFDIHGISLRWDIEPGLAFKADYYRGDSHRGEFDGMTVGLDVVF